MRDLNELCVWKTKLNRKTHNHYIKYGNFPSADRPILKLPIKNLRKNGLNEVFRKYQSLRKRPIFVFAKLLNLLEIMIFVEINFIIGTKIRLF